MRMKLRTRALLTVLLGGLGALIGLLLATYVDRWLILLAIGSPLAAWLYSFTLRCEACGTPMYRSAGRRLRVGPIELRYWGRLVLPQACGQCSAKFY
jgi:hypothetical protein